MSTPAPKVPPDSGSPASPPVKSRWTPAGTGQRYDRDRWSHRGRRDRDPRLVQRLIRQHLALRPGARVLDAPCGTARLRSALVHQGAQDTAGLRYVGLDVSEAMLEAAATSERPALLRGDVERLPFADGSFDVVICCRLLHHLADRALLERVLAELVRVSSGHLMGSFWDAGTLESWRRRLPLARRPRHRLARSRAELEAALRAAGAQVTSWHSSLPGLSQQVWFLARTRP